jgi:hypothetical protein
MNATAVPSYQKSTIQAQIAQYGTHIGDLFRFVHETIRQIRYSPDMQPSNINYQAWMLIRAYSDADSRRTLLENADFACQQGLRAHSHVSFAQQFEKETPIEWSKWETTIAFNQIGIIHLDAERLEKLKYTNEAIMDLLVHEIGHGRGVLNGERVGDLHLNNGGVGGRWLPAHGQHGFKDQPKVQCAEYGDCWFQSNNAALPIY